MTKSEERESLPPSSPGAMEAARSRLFGDPILRVRIIGYLVFVAAWVLASGRLFPEYILPSPIRILEHISEIVSSGLFMQHAVPTLVKIAIGFSIAFVLGVALGIAMKSPLIDAALRTWVTALMSTPGLVFVLVAALVFGFHPAGPIVATVVTAFPFVTVNLAEGVKAMPKELVEMASVFRVKGNSVFRNITVPFLVPYSLTAARFAFSISWKTVTLSELFGSSEGIGFMMRREYQTFNIVALLAWVVTFFVVALVIEKLILGQIEKRSLSWRRQPGDESAGARA